MDVSIPACNQCQKFQRSSDGGGGAVLGMGSNAIVHYVELIATNNKPKEVEVAQQKIWKTLSHGYSGSDLSRSEKLDAAVKRPYSISKMLAFLGGKSEAGMAKRLRMAGALNKHGRLLYFYGLGIVISSNNERREEYKFEAVLLSRYQEEFSTYTLKQFLDDYTANLQGVDVSPGRLMEMRKLQDGFSLIKVKVLLVSLLNAFRDLTLMGVQAFDFNHLNNVLISRDYRKARLIDIDGESKGSIQFPSEYIQGSAPTTEAGSDGNLDLHMPALDIDLSTLLPIVVAKLILGKGRGPSFVTQKISEVKRAQSGEAAKGIIKAVVHENFFAQRDVAVQKHLLKVVEWFHAVLMKTRPWTHWTSDIYDAMRCIDHLPIS